MYFYYVMIYITQLIYVIPGQEAVFQQFEEHVLPLLTRHNGLLMLRIRPSAGELIACAGPAPYEVHLVSFDSEADFETYKRDPLRQRFMQLKQDSVKAMLLIQGEAV